MKSIPTILQKHIPLLGLLFVFLLISSCGGGGAQRQVQAEKLEEAKTSVSGSINDMLVKIQERLDYLDEQIEAAEGETEEKLNEYRLELTAQQDLMKEQIDIVTEANLDNWDEVINQVRSAVHEANKKTNEISLSVREMLEE